MTIAELYRDDLLVIQPGYNRQPMPWNIAVRCSHSEQDCESDGFARTIPGDSTGNMSQIMFCPSYFDDELVMDLDAAMKHGDDGDLLWRNNLNNFLPNRGDMPTYGFL